MSARDMSVKTKVPEPLIRAMLDAVCSEDIGWFEKCPASAHEVPVKCPPDARPKKPAVNGVLKDRIAGWFRRKPTTGWSEGEMKSLAMVEKMHTPDEDIAILEEHYTADYGSQEDYRRRDILTLLNHWNGEIDRAKRWHTKAHRETSKHEKGFFDK